MKVLGTCVIAALLALSGLALAGGEPTDFDFGRQEYEAKCAGCHGVAGKGDGVNKAWLDKSPSDLTTLAKNNGGEFPYMHFYAVVDGRFERGATDMPCFADVYRSAAAKDYMDVPYDEDRYLDTRMVALASHVAALQVK
jgi:mono/diheme cytochrome c family protein